MKLQYTISGYEPSRQLQGAKVPEHAFGSKIRHTPSSKGSDWRKVLKLDVPSATGCYIDPPPKVATLEMRDIQSDRARWLRILNLHGGSGGSPSVEKMFALLRHLHSLEHAVTSKAGNGLRG